VEFAPGARTGFAIMDMEQELQPGISWMTSLWPLRRPDLCEV